MSKDKGMPAPVTGRKLRPVVNQWHMRHGTSYLSLESPPGWPEGRVYRDLYRAIWWRCVAREYIEIARLSRARGEDIKLKKHVNSIRNAHKNYWSSMANARANAT